MPFNLCVAFLFGLSLCRSRILTSPFLSTPFAITLNDTNPELKAWLPPTDCRLRPDQHAFESGLFEKANDLKTDLEEHQRGTRRAREKGELPPHKARWFTRKRDNDTGESFWEPAVVADGSLEYWEERKRVGELKQAGEDHAPWKGVDPICASASLFPRSSCAVADVVPLHSCRLLVSVFVPLPYSQSPFP